MRLSNRPAFEFISKVQAPWCIDSVEIIRISLLSLEVQVYFTQNKALFGSSYSINVVLISLSSFRGKDNLQEKRRTYLETHRIKDQIREGKQSKKEEMKLETIKRFSSKFGWIRMFTSICSLHDVINCCRRVHVERNQRFGSRPIRPISTIGANRPRIDCTSRYRSDRRF